MKSSSFHWNGVSATVAAVPTTTMADPNDDEKTAAEAANTMPQSHAGTP
jgi:hypothetical protein